MAPTEMEEHMEYEIMQLEEKTVAGLSARTNNTSPDMGTVIGGLWTRFYTPGTFDAIPDRCNEKSLGIYTEYAGDEKADYTAIVGCEANAPADAALPAGIKLFKIPAGTYARFIVRGHMQRAVMEFWEKLWSMNLPRAFTCDFEEYQNASVDDAEIHIYISLKN